MNTYTVFYAGNVSKDTFYFDENLRQQRTDYGNTIADIRMGYSWLTKIHSVFDVTKILDTHTLVMKIHANDEEEVFYMMQGENMSSLYRKFINSTGADHTSMSVGDILINDKTGEFLFCDCEGFVRIEN